MEFRIGKNRIDFREGFKPKSLRQFLKTYSSIGSDEELTKIYNKLNGYTSSANRKSKKAKRK